MANNQLEKHIVRNLRTMGTMTGKLLSAITCQNPPTVRKAIQNIRREPEAFLKDGEYLIAFSKGYVITSNKKQIKAFLHKTQTRSDHTIDQIYAMWRLLGIVDENDLLPPEDM